VTMYLQEKWTDRDLEAYAQALYDVWLALGVQDGHHKSYDPLTIERTTHRTVAHSYVFDLWDGGRHHEWDGEPEALRKALLEEAVMSIRGFVWSPEMVQQAITKAKRQRAGEEPTR